MCTAINFLNQKHENAFGRTMDFQYVLDPCLVAFRWCSMGECIGTDMYRPVWRCRHRTSRQKPLRYV